MTYTRAMSINAFQLKTKEKNLYQVILYSILRFTDHGAMKVFICHFYNNTYVEIIKCFIVHRARNLLAFGAI